MTNSSAVDTDHGKSHRSFTVLVNKHKIELMDKKMTGSEIKVVAIAQGAELEQDFQLSVKHGHRYNIIGDDDTVNIKDDLEFIAVAGDDNS